MNPHKVFEVLAAVTALPSEAPRGAFSEPKRCRQIIQDIRKADGSDKILGRASNGTHCGCAKPKKNCDQASARQRENLKVDCRAEILHGGADPHCARLDELLHCHFYTFSASSGGYDVLVVGREID